MNNNHCIICGKFWNDDSLVCDSCEDTFWKDEEAVLGYFHFCGIPATMKQIRKMKKRRTESQPIREP